MAGYLAMKMKRKDLEDVNDDFSDFSLSSPARKIRRLDAELPPIMEEEEADHAEVQKLAPEEAEDVASNINNMNMEELGGLPSNHPHNESEIENENENENEERALVLFNPPIINTHAHPYPLFHSPPSDLSLSLNSDLLLGIKSKLLNPLFLLLHSFYCLPTFLFNACLLACFLCTFKSRFSHNHSSTSH
ncbi:hypothetical protein ACSBR1_039543 [Camellia fascicularis]